MNTRKATKPYTPPGPGEWSVMGILNITPDSFHDGGRFIDPARAAVQAVSMAAAGAGLIDIGGESTRPGAKPVGAEEELSRVVPVIEAVASELEIPVSIDTSKAEVARRALVAGAAVLNDVTALRGDPQMVEVAADAGCPVCLMHMLGEPRTMQEDPHYMDVIAEIREFFRERIDFAVAGGIRRDNLILDPGIGFGKTLEHNLEILRRLDEFHDLGLPLLVGASRKRFIGMIMERGGQSGTAGSADAAGDTAARLPGTIAANLLAFQKGARIFRVHDITENYQALSIAAAIIGS